MVTQQGILTFATKVANEAQDGKDYQYVETVVGREVIIKGTGYALEVFSIDGINYITRDSLDTRNKFKRYLVSSINAA